MTAKGESYAAAAARRARECLAIERASAAKARREEAARRAAAEHERQIRAVEAEFVHARDAAERFDLLATAARAEFDRACGASRRSLTHPSPIRSQAAALVDRSFRLLDGLYERRDAGGCLFGPEWQEAFEALAVVRAKMTNLEAEMRRAAR